MIDRKPADPLDRQQDTVEQVLLPYLKGCAEKNKAPDMADATRYLMKRIDRDLMTMLQDLEALFDGQIAVITGITINTELGNYFSVSTFDVQGQSSIIRRT